MNLTVGQITRDYEILAKLAQDNLTGKQAFSIARILKALEKEVEIFNNTRMELIKKYADKDESGELKQEEGNVHFSDENMAKFNDEINEIFASEIELPVKPIPVEWLDDVHLTVQDAYMLEGIIEE